MMCMCSLIFQDGTCNTIPRALYKCQEARYQHSEQISCQCMHALLVRLHIGGGLVYLVLIRVFTTMDNGNDLA